MPAVWKAVPTSCEAFETFVRETVSKEQLNFAPGWSGNGGAAVFLNQILPCVLRKALATTPGFSKEIATIEYAGSYRRRTTTTVCDMDIVVHTEKIATPAFRQAIVELLVADLKNEKDIEVTASDGAIRVATPRKSQPNRYALLFARSAFCEGVADVISLKQLYHNPTNRAEAEATLDAFYRNNRGAQLVSRMLKYHIYGLKPCLFLYHIDAVVRAIALRKKRGKQWCTKNQGDFYRDVVGELALGVESPVLSQMLEDAWEYDQEVKSAKGKRDKGGLGRAPPLYPELWKQIEALSEFFWEPWNQENIRVKNNPENFFGNDEYLPQFVAVWTTQGSDSDSDLISSLSILQLASKLGWQAADGEKHKRGSVPSAPTVFERGATKDGNKHRVTLDPTSSDAENKKKLLAPRVPAALIVPKAVVSDKAKEDGKGTSKGKKKPRAAFEDVPIPRKSRDFELLVRSAIPNCGC
eukprot:TRINITY_DN17686_c0_g1_i1.p1 TRINITY_DN17686_c0_g1~~TRINITY_DN17686_c0_g1_i1.p1  ORF type:complete len:497 (-),score=92.91 TRINITY_DN17686_c0_g1_i1:66-1469(-)